MEAYLCEYGNKLIQRKLMKRKIFKINI